MARARIVRTGVGRLALGTAAALAAGLLLAAWAERRVAARARAAGLRPPPAWDAPAAADAIAVAFLGNARGLYVDYLWYKSLALFTQDRSRLYKLPLYYKPMGVLQPHFVEMWSATGWALAFNAAAQFREAPRAAWPWVRAGIERMREGLARNPSHPKRWKLHRDLGWTYLLKCTPYRDPDVGTTLREAARAAWGEDPFAAAIRHFQDMERIGGQDAPAATMVPHVWEAWAEASEDPHRERDRLLAAAAAWDARGWTFDPAADSLDHKGRVLALAEGALWTARAAAAWEAQDPDAAHAAWWTACLAYARALLDHRQFFVARGGTGVTPPPACVNWPYAAKRLARLRAPLPLWEEMARAVETAYAGLAAESAAEAAFIREAGRLTDDFRRAAPEPFAARLAGLDGRTLMARARAAAARGDLPSALAYADRIVRLETDPESVEPARRLLEALHENGGGR